ncbi:C-type lectin domain family 4 member F-like [Halichoeres trimaculatus]|uniref:C-type lectin domain family 4 member F-like n=1 Tax=Halichoeres trimaculatus TaxID=147232 RepID=UPI003D9E2620
MAESSIYANTDEPPGFPGKRKTLPECSEGIYGNEETIQTLELQKTGPAHSGAKDEQRTSYRVPAVCLGLLCVFLLIGVIALISQNFKDKSTCSSSMDNLTAELHQLQTSYNNLSEEMDLLQKQRLNDMTELRKFLDQQGSVYFGGSFYYISSLEKTWQNSRDDCRSRGADLIVINSEEEQNFVRGFKKNLWIGLSDSETEEVWKWVDGTMLNQSFWNSGEPNNYQNTNEDCVEITHVNSEGRWNDRRCDGSLFWICEKNLVL